MATSNNNPANTANEVITRNYNTLSAKEKAALKKSADTRVVAAYAKQASLNKIIESFFDHLKKEAITVTVSLSGLKKASHFYNATSATAIFKLGFAICEAGSFEQWVAETYQRLTDEMQLFNSAFVEAPAAPTEADAPAPTEADV